MVTSKNKPLVEATIAKFRCLAAGRARTRLILALLSMATLLGTSAAYAQAPMIMCSDHYPPFVVYSNQSTAPRGTLVKLIDAISQQLNIPITYSAETPFVRCLRDLYAGDADISAGLLNTEERQKHLHMIRYSDHSNKIFYTLADSPHTQIDNWQDLKGLTMGSRTAFNISLDSTQSSNILPNRSPAPWIKPLKCCSQVELILP